MTQYWLLFRRKRPLLSTTTIKPLRKVVGFPLSAKKRGKHLDEVASHESRRPQEVVLRSCCLSVSRSISFGYDGRTGHPAENVIYKEPHFLSHSIPSLTALRY